MTVRRCQAFFTDTSNYTTVSVGMQVTNTQWAGQELNVTMGNGKVRCYLDQSNYTTIV